MDKVAMYKEMIYKEAAIPTRGGLVGAGIGAISGAALGAKGGSKLGDMAAKNSERAFKRDRERYYKYYRRFGYTEAEVDKLMKKKSKGS